MAENETNGLDLPGSAEEVPAAVEPLLAGEDIVKKTTPAWQYAAVLVTVTALMGGAVAGTWMWMTPKSETHASVQTSETTEPIKPQKQSRRDELAAMNPFKQQEQEQQASEQRNAITNALQPAPIEAQQPDSAQPAQEHTPVTPAPQADTMATPPPQAVSDAMAKELKEIQSRAAKGHFSNIDIGIGATREQIVAKFGAPDAQSADVMQYSGMSFSFSGQPALVNGIVFRPQNVVGKLTVPQVQKVLGPGKVEQGAGEMYLTYRAGKYNLYFSAADLQAVVQTAGITLR